MAVVSLYTRNLGVHSIVKSYRTRRRVVENFSVVEDRLIESMPPGWLPVPPSRCLLSVARGTTSLGQVGLKRFMNWSKYFPCYVVHVMPSSVFKGLTKGDRAAFLSVAS